MKSLLLNNILNLLKIAIIFNLMENLYLEIRIKTLLIKKIK